VPDLIAVYRRNLILGEADGPGPSQQQKDAALAALLAWLLRILDDPEYAGLADAITAAMADAIAEGQTAMLAIAADQAAKAGFDWAKAYDAMRAAVTGAQTEGAAGAVTQQIMRAVAASAARELAKLDAAGAPDAELEQALENEIEDDEAAGLAVDTAVSGWYGQGMVALAAAEGILLSWMTAGDGRVCASCQDNEDNGPYDPADFPPLPNHSRCRCCSSPASPLPISAFADFLDPPG
jgi:hypothetical protein